MPDVSFDPSATVMPLTGDLIQFDHSQTTYSTDAIEGIMPAIEHQDIVTKPWNGERELRELRQEVSRLREDLESLQEK